MVYFLQYLHPESNGEKEEKILNLKTKDEGIYLAWLRDWILDELKKKYENREISQKRKDIFPFVYEREDNFNFVGLARGEATRGEEAGTNTKKGKNRGILVYDRQRSSRG